MLPRSLVRSCLLFALGLLAALPVAGQGTDTEPNNACAGAQPLGAISLPLTLDGALDPAPDIDFFALEVPAGAPWIQIDLRGAASGNGTLLDPMVAAFDGDCNFLGINAFYYDTDARLIVPAPADGRLIVAATEYPDYELIGAGPGSYRLTVSEYTSIDSIGGRLIDAETGEPVGAGYSWMYLLHCQDEACDSYGYVAWGQADETGHFVISTDFWGIPLQPGHYRLRVYVHGYEDLTTPPFEALAGEAVDLGDVAIVPYALIGSIRGRLVDAVDGHPLSGHDSPWASVSLERCENDDCYYADWTQADDQGRFVFVSSYYLLFPGTYRLTVWADQYVPTTTATFAVGEDEHRDLGDVLVEPLPLQIVGVSGCSSIPSSGGECRFSIQVKNASRNRVRGAVWAIANAWGTNPLYTFGTFQVGKVGTTNPQPQPFNLAAGQTSTFPFALTVPGSVQDGAYVCATGYVGKNPTPHLDVQGSSHLFCISKYDGAVTLMSEKEGRKKLRELEGKRRG